jgi:23S rRNA (pseudouridine1915-N3)-methyltransferase
MRVRVCAVGRLRAGPERDLVEDWLARFDRTGRPLGLGPAKLVEVEARPGAGPGPEAELLLKAVAGGQGSGPSGAWLCCLDERGEQMGSPDFARLLDRLRGGRREAAFVIGGPDGIDPALVARADLVLSFGRMVWPHMLVRVMLAEQLYRAATILAGTPYHRA